MSIRDYVSREALESASEMTSLISNGTIRRRMMPNTSSEFDEESVIKNAKKITDSGFFESIIKDAYHSGR
jgi:hypothetical protein